MFLLMPFSEDFDWLRDLVVRAGRSIGAQVERADNVFEAGIVVDQIARRIQKADAVVAVCTGQNANVFFELGLSDGLHWPILLAESRADLPFNIQHYRTLIYGDWDEEKLEKSVSASLQDTIEEGRKDSSPAAATSEVPPAAKPRVLGQAMMQVHVWGLEREGSLEHLVVDVLFLAQDVNDTRRNGERAMLHDFPKRGGVLAEPHMVIPAAEEAGVVERNYDPDSGEWYLSLSAKGVRLVEAYADFQKEIDAQQV